MRRTLSRRYLATLLALTVLAVSFHTLVFPHPSPFYLHPTLYVGSVVNRSEHTLTGDGRLLVNPDAPHPIFQLIHDAEAAWDAKRARASKTLDEAVAEYRRRYRRAPPLGFDKWCVTPAPQCGAVCDRTMY